ncbi:MAG: cell division protein ZapE [Methylovulum sp.]|uniref:cell division protein ZapE n=1 Tax=Methylovulum sp. TaxID=1916980 RepID=UPI0026051100|nr:cell division protein ZapE [Methylovulum sp.]MDD2722823.1 cell division protein ZapE [Methylovulum sp.]MDD5124415.1 cell division protein ZapE [Methylovulum sp.]
MLKKIFRQFDLLPLDTSPDMSGLLAEQYIVRVAQKHIQYDPAQIQTLEYLQQILEWLVANDSGNRPFLSKPCQSLYIFGDVGRGKSMLMALFYDACPISQKRRVHFNTFMQEVHAFIHSWQKQDQADAISVLAKNIRGSVRLLCFDEFHVTDIADAMILGRLFSKLFELDLVVVITSNRHPNDLYQGGLLREQFLFFVKVLQNAANIVELSAHQDYRLNFQATQQRTYFYPSANLGQSGDGATQEATWQYFQQLTGGTLSQPGSITVLGREIQLTALHKDILFSSFDELCGQALGSADYLAIANRFNIVIIAAIPCLTAEKRNEAKRFMTLIDVLYEHTIKLVCSAQVPAEALYTEGDGAFEFRRTVSRLIEMQSDNYCQRSESMRSSKPM